jgi:uncharacterized protein YyaL (SSP411 family)
MDNATPSANSTAANSLYRLAALTGTQRYAEHADQILRLLSNIASSAPTAFGNLLAAAHLKLSGIVEIAITGNRPDLLAHMQSQWLPTTVVAWGERYDSPLWQDRSDNVAYVCKQYLCMAPSHDIASFENALHTALK